MVDQMQITLTTSQTTTGSVAFGVRLRTQISASMCRAASLKPP